MLIVEELGISERHRILQAVELQKFSSYRITIVFAGDGSDQISKSAIINTKRLATPGW